MLFRSLAIWLPLLGRIYPGKANLVPCVLRIETGVRVHAERSCEESMVGRKSASRAALSVLVA